jgi:predicted homoserine dehydrogenase-like protein
VARIGKTALVSSGEIGAACEVDIAIEATGFVEAGALHALRAIEAGRHVIVVTVEANVVVGRILQQKAQRNGVVYSMAYGDRPTLICESIDWARTGGFRAAAAGKGTKFLPKYRRSTPDTRHVRYGFSLEKVERGPPIRASFEARLSHKNSTSPCDITRIRNPFSGDAVLSSIHRPPLSSYEMDT